MSESTRPNERLEELLADRAVFGLSPEEEAELRRLAGGNADESDFDRLAAELLEATMDSTEQPPFEAPPASLRDRVASDAEAFFKPSPARAVTPPTTTESFSGREWLAWMVAAAAIALAAFIFRGGLAPDVATPFQQRQQLLADAGDALQIAWLPSKDPNAERATGDVVWSNSRQQGFMRIRNLQPNDPTKLQYQLWIIDGSRDAAQPVDGGVFDIPTGSSEVVIPIDPKLEIFAPKAFAVTIEKPGGVVVSKRERLPLLAPVSAEE